jgi:hypothetical protein
MGGLPRRIFRAAFLQGELRIPAKAHSMAIVKNDHIVTVTHEENLVIQNNLVIF